MVDSPGVGGSGQPDHSGQLASAGSLSVEVDAESQGGAVGIGGRFRAIAFPLVLLVAFAIGLYANTLGHEWAFDDDLVYTENPSVQAGLRGIPRLLGSDAYAHLYESMGREQELSGGRYRPLSLVTFACEVQFFGTDPRIAHAGNVLLYALTCVLLFVVLRRTGWRSRGEERRERRGEGRSVGSQLLSWPFLAALLFAVHPIHTEVVANVKGRDELLSLVFVLFATWLSLGPPRRVGARRARGPGGIRLLAVAFVVFLALLSKEYAVTLLVLLPLAHYVFRGESVGGSLRAALPVVVALVVYLPLRLHASGFGTVEAVDLLNDPYLLATPAEEWASKIVVLLEYLRLLVWPHPLACDYGYRVFPYRTFADPVVWLSFALHAGIVLVSIGGIVRRHWIGFAAAFYLAHLSLISNLFLEIGATMGERLVYHGSAAFAMVVASVFGWGLARTRPVGVRAAAFGLTGLVVLLHSHWTLARNPDWHDDETLFIHDVQVVPESARVRTNAGRSLLARAFRLEEGRPERRALIEEAVDHLRYALSIDPEIVAAYLSLGAGLDQLGDLEGTEAAWNEARKRFPDHPILDSYDTTLVARLSARAVEAAQSGEGDAARGYLERAIRYHPDDPTLWTYLARLCAALGDSTAARNAESRARELGDGAIGR